ncbi:hypothetical protein [Mycobacteroides abscessus]|uniref:hypothetical protein n=1 Tax=Mycobacteroides abscessus TaxID=36809 RepID=UPI00025879F0|nr:hypothetical protein [Mycobacteroides abscessus]EIC67514.1 hypothetical protein OUW_07268 [Mycobacteroides abscessus M93]
MIQRLFDFQIKVRHLFWLAVLLGFPYFGIGLIWLMTHRDHLKELTGFDRLFSTLGEIVAWPVLVIANVSLR